MLISWIILSTFLVILIQPQPIFAQTEDEVRAANPKGDVVSSKYLSITEHRYEDDALISSDGYIDQITGTIVNNSTEKIWHIAVNVALYDKDNKLITLETGNYPDDSALTPGDNSTFSAQLRTPLFRQHEIDHYTLIPSGTPDE